VGGGAGRPLRGRLLRALARRLQGWEEAFRLFAERLCRHPLVAEAYLVGSRARGGWLPYSDYDVLVVVEDGVDPLEAAEELRRLRGEGFPLDLLVVERSRLRDPLIARMLEGARKLC